jgi:hypothetical protein
MQTHKSWMRKGTKSEYDKTKPCKAISHEWEKWLMALHGLVLSYLLFVPFFIHDLWVCMV